MHTQELIDFRQDLIEEAHDAFKKLCRFNGEKIALCVAVTWSEGTEKDVAATNAILDDLGLDERHMLAILGFNKMQEFMDDRWGSPE